MTTDFWLSHVFSVIYVLIVTRIFLEISARDTLPQNERHSLLCVATIEFLPRSFFSPGTQYMADKNDMFHSILNKVGVHVKNPTNEKFIGALRFAAGLNNIVLRPPLKRTDWPT